ncbi:MAG: hypothetical protein NTU47_18345 [Ignavibacteriales bacterium]|nr:hypothetical protein [Ignavibacteriales bacterium]
MRTGNAIDSVGHPPTLLQADITPSSVNTDTINTGASRNPEDLLSISVTVSAQVSQNSDNPLSHVRCSLKPPSSSSTLSESELNDDGAAPDRTKGDGIYTGKVGIQIKRVEIGTFRAEVSAEAQNGFQSNTIIAPLTVYRGNRAPVLTSLDAPDTVTLANQSQSLLLRIKSTDADGLSDLAKVIFNSYKPDGTPSSGNPFLMYDDGSASHGDIVAGDGIYSLIITLPPATSPGTYRFEFQAFDRSNETSAVVVHRITVKQ